MSCLCSFENQLTTGSSSQLCIDFSSSALALPLREARAHSLEARLLRDENVREADDAPHADLLRYELPPFCACGLGGWYECEGLRQNLRRVVFFSIGLDTPAMAGYAVRKSTSMSDVVVSVRDLSYDVPVTMGQKARAKLHYRHLHEVYTAQPGYKRILRNVSLSVSRGEFVGIIGSSGSGKTSLANILANRLYTKTYTGDVQLFGRHLGPWVKHEIGYVQQEDSAFALDSAREALKFVADMRLPNLDHRALVSRILEEIGLLSVADTQIGSVGTASFTSAGAVKGLSGGQRRRCNIGRELVSGSKLLILDECTSGLDIATANSLMHLLHELSRHPHDYLINPNSEESRLTVVATLHQPTARMWDLLDRIIVMSNGEVVYDAPTAMFESHMADLGIAVSRNNSPADFLIEFVSGPESQANCQKLKLVCNRGKRAGAMPLVSTLAPLLEDRTRIVRQILPSSAASEQPASGEERGAPTYSAPALSRKEPGQRFRVRESSVDRYKRIREQDRTVATQAYMSAFELLHAKEKYVHNYWRQFWLLYERFMRFHIRNPTTFVRFICQFTIMSLFTGSLWWRLGGSFVDQGNKVGALFFCQMMCSFPPAGDISVRAFSNRCGYLREHACGLYGTGPYFLAQLLADFPIYLVMTAYFGTLTFWMVGYIDNAWRWVLYCVTLLFVLYSVASMATFFTNLFSSYVAANVMLMVCMAILIVFAGPYINSGSIPSYWSWMPWVSVFAYSFRALMYICVSGTTVVCVPGEFCPATSDTEVLAYYGLGGYSLTGAVLMGLGFMTCWICGFMTVACFLLRFRRFS